MRKLPHEANDFIIHNGVYVRDFDAMYQAIEDPWNQSQNFSNDLLTNSALWLIRRLFSNPSRLAHDILDIGCGQGYMAAALIKMTGDSTTNYVGTDISPNVINKALANISEGLRNQIQFHVDDIRNTKDEFLNRFDFVFSGKTLYYVAPEIDLALHNIERYLIPGGIFAFTYNQGVDAFYKKMANL